MKIGLLSDTHDHINNIRKALEIFQQRGVELVVHAGDYCSPPAVRALQGLPLAGVLGNNDGERIGLAKAFESLQGRMDGELLELELPEGRMAVYHGVSAALVNSLIGGSLFAFVVYGHTHRVDDRTVQGVRVLNPGTAHGFGAKATVMVLDTESGKVELVVL